ncbi:hypothetical protein [Nocardia sp. NPDC052316]|uniref:hypothetical protein n=1 Tax=Nocardia sp. NPDC052316 TaxID=3364329 RepID=UPI0037CB9FF2
MTITIAAGGVLMVSGAGLTAPAVAAEKARITLKSAEFVPAAQHTTEGIEVTVSYNCAKGVAEWLQVEVTQTSPEPENDDEPASGTSSQESVTCDGEDHTAKVGIIDAPADVPLDEWHHPGSGDARAILSGDKNGIVAQVKGELRW